MTSNTMHLHTNLKHLRSLRGYSVAVVAEALDVKRTRLSGWENGASEPSCTNLMKLGAYYRLNLDLLLREDLTSMATSIIEEMQRRY